MPAVFLAKTVHMNGQPVRAWHPALMVKFNDRNEVIDPSNNNVLVKGATDSFIQDLMRKDLLRMASAGA